MTYYEKKELAKLLHFKTKVYNQICHNENRKKLTTAYFHEINSLKNFIFVVGGNRLYKEIKNITKRI